MIALYCRHLDVDKSLLDINYVGNDDGVQRLLACDGDWLARFRADQDDGLRLRSISEGRSDSAKAESARGLRSTIDGHIKAERRETRKLN
jgi:hypothetical protein